jgi:hypothetical protein
MQSNLEENKYIRIKCSLDDLRTYGKDFEKCTVLPEKPPEAFGSKSKIIE